MAKYYAVVAVSGVSAFGRQCLLGAGSSEAEAIADNGGALRRGQWVAEFDSAEDFIQQFGMDAVEQYL